MRCSLALDLTFLLEDRKRLIGEVKRVESYCAEVEIARRDAESEVAALKAQIAAVTQVCDDNYAAQGLYIPASEVRAALNTGSGEQK